MKTANREFKNLSVWLLVMCFFVFLFVLAGCHSSWVDKIGPDMDKMAKDYEKFGTVSMSCPILVEAKPGAVGSGFLDFNLTTGADDYYEYALANVQGQSAIFDQFVKTSGFGLDVQMNLMALMGYKECLNDYNLPHAAKNVAPDANNALRVLSGKNFTKFLGLLDGNSAPSISNRSAITTAAGDTVTEGIFRLLGNPAEAMRFQDKLIMFGVSMVSVNPGWLTNKNYTAELAVSCSYSYQPARRDLLIELKEKEEGRAEYEKDKKLIELINRVLDDTPIDINQIDFIPQRFQKWFRERCTPLSAAVSPMTDVDSLDLASSQRLQVSEALRIAAGLSYAGLKADSEFFRQWAKRHEQDVRTRTACAAVTAFSDGEFFGWRLKPRLQALENPASFDSKPENVLGHQAFPIVVIIGIDRDDLQLGFDIEPGPDGKPRFVAYEPMISFRQTVNWLPNKSPCNLRERLSETERLRLASSLIQVNKNLISKKLAYDSAITRGLSVNINFDQIPTPDDIPEDFIKNRLSLLGSHLLGSTGMQYVPIELMVKKAPVVAPPRKPWYKFWD